MRRSIIATRKWTTLVALVATGGSVPARPHSDSTEQAPADAVRKPS